MPSTRQVIREELLRSIAWAGLSMVGWALAITEFEQVPATPLAAFGLPVLTWAFLTTASITVRLLTGREFRVQSRVGLALVVAVSVAAGGFAAVYAVLGLDYPLLWVGPLYGAVTVVTVLWIRYTVVPVIESEPLA